MRVLEPMFAVEAKKRQVRKSLDSVKVNLPEQKQTQAREQAAEVVSASAVTLGTTPFLFEYRH